MSGYEPEKRPRHYAAEIIQLDTLEQRRQALEKVPAHLQEHVKTHVRNFWALRHRKGGRGR